VLRDGRRFEVEAYRIEAELVVLQSGSKSTTVPLSEVDFEATFHANAEPGEESKPLKVFRDPKLPFEFRILSWKADATAGDLGSVSVHAELVNLDTRRYREVQVEILTVDAHSSGIDKVTTVVGPVEAKATAELMATLRYYGGETDVLAHVVKTKR